MKTNKKQNKTAKELPVIKIKSIKDIMYSQINVDMDDEVYDMLADYGKKIITKDDYVQLGFLAALKNGLDITSPKTKKKGKTK